MPSLERLSVAQVEGLHIVMRELAVSGIAKKFFDYKLRFADELSKKEIPTELRLFSDQLEDVEASISREFPLAVATHQSPSYRPRTYALAKINPINGVLDITHRHEVGILYNSEAEAQLGDMVTRVFSLEDFETIKRLESVQQEAGLDLTY